MSILIASAATAQDKPVNDSKPVPPPPPPPAPVKIEFEKEAEIPDEGIQYFGYMKETPNDGMVQVEERVLEYGWSDDLARIVITEYNYDPVKRKEAEEAGYQYLARTKTLQYIEGRFHVEGNTLIFTPDKPDKFDTVTFGVQYNKSKKITSLTGPDQQAWSKMEGPEFEVAQ